MERRERLIEIIQANTSILPSQEQSINNIADALIEAGALLPKFRVGQKVYYSIKFGFQAGTVYKLSIYENKIIYYLYSDIYGNFKESYEEKIFATEDEARAALEGK